MYYILCPLFKYNYCIVCDISKRYFLTLFLFYFFIFIFTKVAYGVHRVTIVYKLNVDMQLILSLSVSYVCVASLFLVSPCLGAYRPTEKLDQEESRSS